MGLSRGIGGRAVSGYRIRISLLVTAAVLVMVNALAPWGDETAFRVDSFLQVCTVAVAVVYGLIVACRVHGSARLWRLLAVGALICLTAGEIAWWNRGNGVPPQIWVTSYWLFLILATASVVVLTVAARGVEVPPDSSLRLTALITVLDGGVAAASFALLVIIGRFGAFSVSSWPQSGNPAVETAYAIGQLILVVFAAVVGMMYSAARPYRSNYLQLACGFVVIVASDRVVAYFDSVGAPYAQSWGGVGVVLGPLFIALSMRERSGRSKTNRFRPMDWAQLILPYTGFLGITILLSYHVLTGHILDAVVVSTTLVMVMLVAARQIAAMGAQRLLTRRLYEAQRGLAHQVFHDSLTGLPNRLLFAQRLDEAMQGGKFVLIFVDLDDFKEVNDRFGHAAGDELLCAVGDRLKRSITSRDTLARIGGDEFAILVVGEHDMPEVVADRLRVALREPFPVHGSSVRVRASMGLVRAGDGGNAQTSDDLLRQADISMYAGKRLGKNTAVVYQPMAGVRAEFPAALREARGGVPEGFSLAYQPVVQLPDERLVAVEALARWTAPNGIVIPPETFVAVAESAGLGATLDALVLDLACREVEEAGLGDVNIHVNVGAARLGNLGFEEQVRNTLSHCSMDPHCLVLEITETLPIVDLDDAAAQIRRLNEIGVRMALDDFGAGYNSLTYLHALPVQIVKLDRSLAVGSDPDRDLALYRSVIGLCSDLGLDVVAEGIETRLQADTVHAAGCQYAQGHLFGKPVPMSVLGEEWRDRPRGQAPQFASGQSNRD